MTETPQTSGKDLARQALAAARARAKTAPAPGPKKTRRPSRPTRGGHGDPQGLGRILERLTTEQGWDASLGGGNLIDQWPQICPAELATTVQPVAYDAERGILELRPSSPAYATQLRLFQQQLARHLNAKLGRPAVRGIRVLTPGGGTAAVLVPPPEAEQPDPAPVKTRETASAGYREALAAVLEHRPEPRHTDPYIAAALERQEAALRANRQPESEHQDAVWAQDEAERKAGPRPGSMEASERGALAYARSQAVGRTPRAFDVA